jgi:glyoxylase-like metal-dependent hydrolase (beta-lactamase superfamily II)
VDVDKAGREAVASHVDVIVNSHAHEDHFAGNHLFPEANLRVHEEDAPQMRSLDALMDAYGTPEAERETMRKFLIEGFNYRPRNDLNTITGGEVLDLGRTRVHCIHTPGHTPGHLILLFEPDDVLFVADLDLTAFGPFYGDACASLEDTITSIQKMRSLSGSLNACISSHQAVVARDDIAHAMDRYLDVVWEREARLLAFLAKPRTLEEIADHCIVYRKKYPNIPWQYQAEKTMMSMHVDRLLAQERVVMENGRIRAE